MAKTTTDPQPGDWFVVNTGSDMARGIRVAEFLADGFRQSEWNHAGIASRRRLNGKLMVVEAAPGGATERAFEWGDHPHMWVKGTPECGTAALKYVGTPYSYLDYAALTAHALRFPDLPVWYQKKHVGGEFVSLSTFISSEGHMICSQLVDQACQDAGNHLFTDNRWAGYVKPSDLGRLAASGQPSPGAQR